LRDDHALSEPPEGGSIRADRDITAPGSRSGWVCAQIAEVPEAISQGRTVEEAKVNVAEALELALAWRREEGEALPARVQVTVTPVTVAAA